MIFIMFISYLNQLNEHVIMTQKDNFHSDSQTNWHKDEPFAKNDKENAF